MPMTNKKKLKQQKITFSTNTIRVLAPSVQSKMRPFVFGIEKFAVPDSHCHCANGLVPQISVKYGTHFEYYDTGVRKYELHSWQ